MNVTNMTNTSANNRRIARNTLFLYIRMAFMMGVTLYTSRVILNALGVADYGIYNVVGGFVSMFAVVSGSLSNAISRFITYELGKGDLQRLRIVFSTGVNIQLGMSVLVILIAEGVGIWFLNTHMNIPESRMAAANWVFQCAVLTFVINLLSVPYNAAIIAHEKMSAFAYIAIFEVALKLVIVFLLLVSPFDRLETYAMLLVLVGVIIRLIYGIYCKRNFEECTYHFLLDTTALKEMTGFAGWNFLGNCAWLLNTQGVNILMNLYFSVAVNAARGVAMQVDTALRQFVNNFTTAINPQITKSYAQGDLDYMHNLMCKSAKFSAFLMLFFAVPIILESQTILTIWLKTVPDYSAVFVNWVTISMFMEPALSNSYVTAMLATGRIKKYQIVITTVGCLVFPLSWIAFELGFKPQSSYLLFFLVYAMLLLVRLYLLREMIHIPIKMFFDKVVIKLLSVMVIGVAAPALVSFVLEPGWTRLILVCIVSTVVIAFAEYKIGLSTSEKKFVLEKMGVIFNKLRKSDKYKD